MQKTEMLEGPSGACCQVRVQIQGQEALPEHLVEHAARCPDCLRLLIERAIELEGSRAEVTPVQFVYWKAQLREQSERIAGAHRLLRWAEAAGLMALLGGAVAAGAFAQTLALRAAALAFVATVAICGAAAVRFRRSPSHRHSP